MILLELAAGSAALPVDACHPAAGQGALHGTTVQDGGHLGAADSGTQGFPPPRPKQLLPGFDVAGGPLQLALSFQMQGLPGTTQSDSDWQGPDLPQPPPKK